ncbi:prion-inhibition and propagation-domain-containing protein [Stachybotrys elegans]|uniref:Prion-inhibition and propagation-domain-containing protein n=1 Tax=Stachybotrys elegans TaxID=80388 RepID=A0A8K0WMU8_9HYPO|nr:prion-inhibition and propagation-domain-containing protein [Stachybotrys elegans]
MAEVAGLVLGALGIAGLFTACIENFDIIVRARECSEEFELLCTQLALQRLRLVIWGETLGLVPAPNGGAVPYNRALERKDIRPVVETSLHQLKLLLCKADVINGRYALPEEEATVAQKQLAGTSSHGMDIFRESFERFRMRISKSQKQKSVWTVTRWAIHDYQRFETLVDQITKLLDALESITSALGILEQHNALLVNEIESLSNTESLSLLQRVGSSTSASVALREVSETASIRLSIMTSSSRSYFTAPQEQTGSLAYNRRQAMLARAWEAGEAGASKHLVSVYSDHQKMTEDDTYDTRQLEDKSITDIPHQQRWMAALMKDEPELQKSRSIFSEKDMQYGCLLQEFKNEDDEICGAGSGRLAVQAHENLPLARRVFLELRNIRRAKISFISAVPVEDSLDKILASIEGPPGTPYEGGIFWIAVKMMESKPPLLRFHTRIYHPNVDPSGTLCADYASWWRDTNQLNQHAHKIRQRSLPWFSEHATNHYSLGALLVAICGLLAAPNIEDPLVPEIAEKYCTDYQGYCKAAELYTARYARTKRPDLANLVFPSEGAVSDPSYVASDYKSKQYSESLVAEGFSIAEQPALLWEQIPDYMLSVDELCDALRGWFPDTYFDAHEILSRKTGHSYSISIPRHLNEVGATLLIGFPAYIVRPNSRRSTR